MIRPAYDLAEWLNGRIPDVTLGSNLFIGEEFPPLNGQALTNTAFVVSTGGPEPEGYLGSRRESIFRPTVQFTIRGEPGPGSWESGDAWVSALYREIHLAQVPGYIAVRCRESAPLYHGLGPDACPRWTFNVECWAKG